MQHIPSQPPPGDRSLANHLLRGLNALPGVYPLLAFVFCARVHVVGWSMSPTLLPNEYALFDTLAYRLRPPQRDDIVLVRDPRTPTRTLIKRLAGVPGDAVRVGEDGCWINGACALRRRMRPLHPLPLLLTPCRQTTTSSWAMRPHSARTAASSARSLAT